MCLHPPPGNQLANLPPPSDLLEANIRQYEEVGDQHPTDQQFVDHHSSLDAGPQSIARGSQHLVSVGEGLPVLPIHLIKQIQRGDYVDFSDLPPCRGSSSTFFPKTVEGQAVLLDLRDVVRAKRLPPDFQSWVQCFALYMAVVAQVHPHRIPDLLAYQCSIARYSKKYVWPSWVVYDINFRQSKALTPGSSWAKTDGGFFAECFTSMRKDQGEPWCRICHSMDHSSSSCPLAPPSKMPRRNEADISTKSKRPAICINFNTKGCTFKKCKRQHICFNCRGKHPATSCPTPPPGGLDCSS